MKVMSILFASSIWKHHSYAISLFLLQLTFIIIFFEIFNLFVLEAPWYNCSI